MKLLLPQPSTPGRKLIASFLALLLSAGCGQESVVKSTPSVKHSPSRTEAISSTNNHAPDADVAGGVSSAEPRPEKRSHDFAGSRACAACHAEIAAAYAGHPMSRSLGEVTAVEKIENYSNETSTKSFRFRNHHVEHLGDRIVHHEVQRSPEGKVLYDQGVEVHFSVGSGQRGRSYLTNRDGYLFMSPLTWYSRDRVWDLSPGYRAESNARFERQISDGCLACHAGEISADATVANRYSPDKPFVEESIGCERCHGPGATHVERYQKANQDLIDHIVNPAKLDGARQEAVCNQCHLQGGRRVTRYGRNEFDFRPGDRLCDIWIVFQNAEPQTRDKTMNAATQADQMHESMCYKKSNRMGCSSCHDPHSIPKAGLKNQFYEAKCLKCHDGSTPSCSLSPNQRETQSCIECHMPRLSANDVPHTSQTDHRVLRKPLSKPAPRPATKPDRFAVYSDGGSSPPDWEIKRAKGIVLAETAEKIADIGMAVNSFELLRELDKRLPDDAVLFYSLGKVCLQLENQYDAVKYFEQGLAAAPKDAPLLEALAVFHHQRNNLEDADRYYSRLIQVQPWRADFHGRHAHVLGQLGRMNEGIASAQRALELNPSLSQVHGWLADVYNRQGNQDLSDHHRVQYKALVELASPKTAQ